MYKKIKIFDLEFISAQSHYDFIDEVVNYETYLQSSKKLPFLITPNADQLVNLAEKRNTGLRKKLENSLFILPDGQSIILFSRLIRNPLKKRLNGSDLFPILWNIAKQQNQKILTITPNNEVGSRLKADYLNIVYYSPPLFNPYKDIKVLEEIIADSVEIIKNFNPKYVIVGVGFPKQEFISVGIYTQLLKQCLPSPLFLLLGCSFEFYVKVRKRAPPWMLAWGLEWLYRLIQEPGRMWKRYFFGAFRLTLLWMRWFSKEFHTNK